MSFELKSTPRLYADHPFVVGRSVELSQEQTHYVRNVMRLEQGAMLRLFNGRDGEFTARITDLRKKTCLVELLEQVKSQPQPLPRLHLLFAPIQKQRMDMLVEKAVELGATDLYPILTQYGQVRKIKEERTQAQIIEAAEQSERLDLPVLHELCDLKTTIARWSADTPIYWAAERQDAPILAPHNSTNAFLIGPEGGFSDDECAFLSAQDHIQSVSLGDRILRAETASFYCLSLAQSGFKQKS